MKTLNKHDEFMAEYEKRQKRINDATAAFNPLANLANPDDGPCRYVVAGTPPTSTTIDETHILWLDRYDNPYGHDYTNDDDNPYDDDDDDAASSRAYDAPRVILSFDRRTATSLIDIGGCFNYVIMAANIRRWVAFYHNCRMSLADDKKFTYGPDDWDRHLIDMALNGCPHSALLMHQICVWGYRLDNLMALLDPHGLNNGPLANVCLMPHEHTTTSDGMTINDDTMYYYGY